MAQVIQVTPERNVRSERAMDVAPVDIGRVAELPRPQEADDSAGTGILSRNHFVQQLRLEKRRSDRSGAPLSLLLLKVAPERRHFGDLGSLVDIVRQTRRETDLLGYLEDGLVGLLLTHTDAAGLETFTRKLAARTVGLSYALTSGTYPDQIFESLTLAKKDTPDTLPFFLDTDLGHGDAQLFMKRCIDVVGALALLVLFSPVMLLTALAVKVTSPGPVIFQQVRLGRRGAPFKFYKFRSMRTKNDDRIHREYVASLIQGKTEQVNQGDPAKPVYKIKRDPRVTAVGRVIRKTSIDELPQLINVLKGDMSLVGPRPPIPYEAESYQAWHLRRVLEARPGITGLWQVEGRSRVSFDDMVRLDLRYTRTWSLWLDLKILVRTVGAVLRLEGAD